MQFRATADVLSMLAGFAIYAALAGRSQKDIGRGVLIFPIPGKNSVILPSFEPRMAEGDVSRGPFSRKPLR
jgi:hypothetical protein